MVPRDVLPLEWPWESALWETGTALVPSQRAGPWTLDPGPCIGHHEYCLERNPTLFELHPL